MTDTRTPQDVNPNSPLGVGLNTDPQGLGQMPPAAIPQVTAATPTPAAPAPASQPTPPGSGAPMPSVFAPAPGTPQSSSAPPNTQEDPQALHQSVFARVLRGLSNLRGTPTQYIDATGKPVAYNRATLGNSILAGAIAGMFAKPQTIEGKFGPINSSGGTVSEAFKAGQEQTQQAQDRAQSLSDSEITHRYATIKNSIANEQQYHALAQQQHATLDEVADNNQKTVFAALQQYDKDNPDNRLIQGTDLSNKESLDLMQSTGHMTTWTRFITGHRSALDPDTGRETVEPTYSVVRTDGEIPMSQDAVDMLSKLNPQYATAYKLTGGNMPMSVNRYLSDMHLYNSMTVLEETMKSADKDLGIDAGKIDFFKAARENPKIKSSFMEAENALAQGGTPVDVLDRILKDPNGHPGAMLAAMGMTPQQAREYVNDQRTKEEAKREAALTIAKEGVLNPKAPASDAEKTAARNVIAQLPKEQQAEFLVTLDNPDGIRSGDIKDLMKQARDQYNKNRELDPNGTGISTTQAYPNNWQDPKTGKNYNLADSLFNAVEGNEDPTQFSKRSKTYNGDLARANEYSFARYGKPWDPAQATIDYKFAQNTGTQNTLKYLNSLTGANNTGGNLQSLVDASNRVDRTDFPALNNAAAWARMEVGNKAIAQYHTAVTEVADQVAKILQGGGSGGGTSDAKLKQAQELFQTGFSKDVLKAVTEELRGLLANRKTEFIGNNRYLQKQFPQEPQGNSEFVSMTKDGKWGQKKDGTWVTTGK
jgi:hypothetical protein